MEAHFASPLGLCPDNRLRGDKVLSTGTWHVVSPAATALHMAATTLIRSRTDLGAIPSPANRTRSAKGEHSDCSQAR